MEEVTYNDIDRNLSFLILSRHLQQLFLVPVTQLALPEAHAIFRHHGNLARRIAIGLFDFIRGISCRDPVIHLFGAFGIPFRGVGSEAHAADRRIVP